MVIALTVAAGAGVSAWALRIPAGDPRFLAATTLLALIWSVGAFVSGPIHLGVEPYKPTKRPIGSSLFIAAVLAAVFCLGATIVAQVPPLRDPVQELLAHATGPSVAAVVVVVALNGIAEEYFYRGAVYSASYSHHPIATSTLVYAAVVATSGVALLVFAAVILGIITAIQRRCTGGVLGPCITHVTWSLVMLIALNPILTFTTLA